MYGIENQSGPHLPFHISCRAPDLLPLDDTTGCRGTEGCVRGKALAPQDKRQAVATMRHELAISERRACRLVGLSRTTLRRVVAEEPAMTSLRARIIDLAHARRRFGYRRIHDLLRREGVHESQTCLSVVSRCGVECA